jgi:DNA-directed RNA polymerase subunit beta
LLKELQSLALDVKVLTESGDELVIREVEEEDDAADNAAANRDAAKADEMEEIDFSMDDEDEEEGEFGVTSIFEEEGDDEDGFNIDSDEDDDFGDEDDDTFGFGKLFDEDDGFDDEE